MNILIYENNKVLEGYKISANNYFPIPRVGDYISYKNNNYKVRQVVYDYNNLDSKKLITVHIYCGEKT